MVCCEAIEKECYGWEFANHLTYTWSLNLPCKINIEKKAISKNSLPVRSMCSKASFSTLVVEFLSLLTMIFLL